MSDFVLEYCVTRGKMASKSFLICTPWSAWEGIMSVLSCSVVLVWGKSESGNITVSEKFGTLFCVLYSVDIQNKMLRKNLSQMSLLICCFVKYVQEHLFQRYQQKMGEKVRASWERLVYLLQIEVWRFSMSSTIKTTKKGSFSLHYLDCNW